jgi:hypothetical protein
MSAVACAEVVRDYLAHLGERFTCREREGRLWVISPYAHPDGDLVEVCVAELPGGEVMVSDLGETLRHLADLGFDPHSTRKGAYLIGEVTKQYGVALEQGMLVKRAPASNLGDALQDVLSACVAVSHLIFLSPGFRPATFSEQVAQYLAKQQVGFSAGHYETGRTGRRFRVDFLIRGRERDGLLKVLSPATRARARAMANATFRLWSDVENSRWRATLLDDRFIEWRREDVALLEGVSEVYRWSERDGAFRRALVALGRAGRARPASAPGPQDPHERSQA